MEKSSLKSNSVKILTLRQEQPESTGERGASAPRMLTHKSQIKSSSKPNQTLSNSGTQGQGQPSQAKERGESSIATQKSLCLKRLVCIAKVGNRGSVRHTKCSRTIAAQFHVRTSRMHSPVPEVEVSQIVSGMPP